MVLDNIIELFARK